jgi:hypothetical protein
LAIQLITTIAPRRASFGAAVVFAMLHDPQGIVVEINPDQVTSLRNAPSQRQGNFTEEANCLVNLTDGKFITVKEDCKTVRSLLEQAKRGKL